MWNFSKFSLMFVIIQMLLYHSIIRWEPNVCLDLVETEKLHSEIRVWTKIWHWSFVQENRAQKSAEGDKYVFYLNFLLLLWNALLQHVFIQINALCDIWNSCFLQTYNFLVDIERCIWPKLIYWRKKIIRPCLLRRIMAH